MEKSLSLKEAQSLASYFRDKDYDVEQGPSSHESENIIIKLDEDVTLEIYTSLTTNSVFLVFTRSVELNPVDYHSNQTCFHVYRDITVNGDHVEFTISPFHIEHLSRSSYFKNIKQIDGVNKYSAKLKFASQLSFSMLEYTDNPVVLDYFS